MLKGNNINTNTRCKICSKLKIKTQRRHWHCSSLLLTLNIIHIMFYSISIFNIKHVIPGYVLLNEINNHWNDLFTYILKIVYKKTDEWYLEWQRVTTSDNEWYNEWQEMTTSDKEWQWVVQRVTTSGTTSDNEWYNEWQRVVQRVTTSDNE